MKTKKRRANDSNSKRMTRKKVKKEDETEQLEIKLPSLTPLAEEKQYYDDHIKTRLSLKVDEKNPKIVLPKVKITCVPLNVEKIIDFESNIVNLNEVDETKINPEKKTKKASHSRSKKSKTTSSQVVDSNENFSHVEPSKSKITKTRNKVKEMKKMDCANASPLTCSDKGRSDDSNKIKSTEKSKNESQLNCRKQLVFNFNSVKETNLKCQSFQINPNQNYMENSNKNVDNETSAAQDLLDCLPFCGMDDESALLELNDVDLEDLAPTIEGISDEALKIKGNKIGADVNDVITSSIPLNSNNSTYLRCKDVCELEEVKNDLSSQCKTCLQATIENFMSNSQLKCLKEISALKKGLCFTWLSNNYVCANQKCFYSHCAVKLFTRKMRTYPSKFILNIVVSMTDDILFVDAIMAAFKILSARKVPLIWVTVLIYFVFYVTEPSDSRFLKFWANAARFYCQLSNEYAAANGFASLLSVFSKGEKSEEWKIIEFIKLIKKPPIQVSTNFELLQPVLKLDLPFQFLTEAVESCIATQKDVLKVYLWVIPKISLMTSPVQTIELLLKFCKILEVMDLNIHANDLKRRLRVKVKTFKTKITHFDYPLTAAFQEDILLDPRESDCLNTSESIADSQKQTENVPESMPLEALNQESNYFQLENDFYGLMVRTLELTCAAVPDEAKIPSFLNNINNETQDDICERQINRIQQFFCNCQFHLLGKYLNDLRPSILERAAEQFLKLLFQMKISLQQGVDLTRIILLHCKTDSAAKINASICITLILNLVRINEWEKAYTIMSLCQEKQINLIEGKVFYLNEFNNISQCRIVLLLIEINANSGNYQGAMKLIKNHCLFSSKSSLWKLTWKPYDENIRIRIIEDFLQQVTSKQLTEIAYDLFVCIWKEQKQLYSVVDLRKFVNEVIIMLLNEGNEEAVTVYEKVKAEVQLNDITVRAILVTLVRLNRLSAAKSVLISTTPNVYSFPHIISGSAAVMISSFWLEEEIYMVFDTFLELLASKRRTLISKEFENLEISIQILKPNFVSTSRIIPLCLGIINPAFTDVCNRIQRVLLQFSPPVTLIVMPYCLKLDEYSLQVNLYNRVCQNAKDH